MRRSVTIENGLNNYIIEVRGWLGLQKHIETDYTTILNMLAKLGIETFSKVYNNPDSLSETEKRIIEGTLEADPNQRIEAIQDELWNQKLRANVPEYDPVENLLTDDSNSGNEKEGESTLEPEQHSPE